MAPPKPASPLIPARRSGHSCPKVRTSLLACDPAPPRGARASCWCREQRTLTPSRQIVFCPAETAKLLNKCSNVTPGNLSWISFRAVAATFDQTHADLGHFGPPTQAGAGQVWSASARIGPSMANTWRYLTECGGRRLESTSTMLPGVVVEYVLRGSAASIRRRDWSGESIFPVPSLDTRLAPARAFV